MHAKALHLPLADWQVCGDLHPVPLCFVVAKHGTSASTCARCDHCLSFMAWSHAAVIIAIPMRNMGLVRPCAVGTLLFLAGDLQTRKMLE